MRDETAKSDGYFYLRKRLPLKDGQREKSEKKTSMSQYPVGNICWQRPVKKEYEIGNSRKV